MFVYRIDENSQIRAQDGNFFDVDCTYTEKHGRYDKWEGLKGEKSTTRSERCAYRETIYRLAAKPIPRVVWPYHNNLASQRRFPGFTQNPLATDWKGDFMSQFDSKNPGEVNSGNPYGVHGVEYCNCLWDVSYPSEAPFHDSYDNSWNRNGFSPGPRAAAFHTPQVMPACSSHGLKLHSLGHPYFLLKDAVFS